MMADWFLVVSQVSVISCGLVAGVFLTFSDLVMKSLAAPRPAGGIECMQVINRKVFKTVFMVLLLGMSALAPLLVGGAIYLVGVLLVTLIFNVPMNQRLDALDFSGSEVASYWKTYVPNWSFWNHVSHQHLQAYLNEFTFRFNRRFYPFNAFERFPRERRRFAISLPVCGWPKGRSFLRPFSAAANRSRPLP